MGRRRTKVRIGDLIEVDCIKHGWACSCAPGPWRLVRMADEHGFIRAEHTTRRLPDGRAPTLGACIEQVRIAQG